MPQNFYDQSPTLRLLRPEERAELESQRPQSLTEAIALAVKIIIQSK